MGSRGWGRGRGRWGWWGDVLWDGVGVGGGGTAHVHALLRAAPEQVQTAGACLVHKASTVGRLSGERSLPVRMSPHKCPRPGPTRPPAWPALPSLPTSPHLHHPPPAPPPPDQPAGRRHCQPAAVHPVGRRQRGGEGGHLNQPPVSGGGGGRAGGGWGTCGGGGGFVVELPTNQGGAPRARQGAAGVRWRVVGGAAGR